MVEQPSTAMILAAGRGERMRPLTDEVPKPLLELAGRPLIDHVLDRLKEAGVRRVVVNLHHLPDKLRAHLDRRTDMEIAYADESDGLMGTGGGIAQALPLLGEGPFYVVNGDAPWYDSDGASLLLLADIMAGGEADAVLLLHPTISAVGYRGAGDYFLDPAGRSARRRERPVVPFVYTGTQLARPRLFRDGPAGAFSVVDLFDRAEQAGRLFGLRHQGLWMRINTANDLERANRTLAAL